MGVHRTLAPSPRRLITITKAASLALAKVELAAARLADVQGPAGKGV